jgi:hypothetical protein
LVESESCAKEAVEKANKAAMINIFFILFFYFKVTV